MKKVVVTFPPDMTISTSAAQGLGVCSSAQLALGTNKPVTCPDSSQYGQLTLHTPILPPDQPMRGYIYIAKKGDNPYNNFLSMYFVIQEPDRDLLIKIPGKIDLDPVTGQIKVTFDDLPQFPLSDMQLTFKGGVRSALVNPRTCGNKKITADLLLVGRPEHADTVSSSYDMTHKADGTPCATDLSEPAVRRADVGRHGQSERRRYTPFLFRMTRTDDDQEISQIGTNMPPGLTARIAGHDDLLRRGDRGGGEPAADRPHGAREPVLPGLEPGRHDRRRLRRRRAAELLPRTPLPRRPVQGRAALVRRRSPRPCPGPMTSA